MRFRQGGVPLESVFLLGGWLLHDFLTRHREELIDRCRAKVAKRPVPLPTSKELLHGIPVFLDQIIKTLKLEAAADLSGSYAVAGPPDPKRTPAPSEIGRSAAEHGDELQRKGFTVDQVVHDYGDLCQSITELAVERDIPIAATEFQVLNRCLDNAVADAVTRFGDMREQSIRDRASHDIQERLGFLAHELNGKLHVALLAIEAIKRGTVGLAGATGAALDRSLAAMHDIIDRSFAEVRLGVGLPQARDRFSVELLFEQVQIFAGMEAGAKGLVFVVRPGEVGLTIEGDRHTIASAVSNLLQNAIKFTPRGGQVSLTARISDHRVLIEVADACGGLPKGTATELFRPFVQRNRDKSGLGLGLSISQRGVEANGGKLTVRDEPGRGCVFTIDLPQSLS